jgi:hypothetical protein
MTWIFFGWMFFRLASFTSVVSTDPGNTWTLDGTGGQPPKALDGTGGQPPKALDGTGGQPPSRL